MWEEKTKKSYFRENPRNQVGTENPIHIVPSPDVIRTRVLKVEGEENTYNANPTTKWRRQMVHTNTHREMPLNVHGHSNSL